MLTGFVASGVLGLVRLMVFSALFGTSDQMDAYAAAQRIPETLFTLVAGGALGSSFIPVFARFFAQDDEDGAWRLASAILSTVTIAAIGLSLVIMLIAPHIIPPLLVPDARPEMQMLTVELTQIMMLTVIIFSASGLLMGILNARQLFSLPALALSMNNIGQIGGALLLTPFFGIYGLAFGAVIGALLHLGIQLPGLRRVGARLSFLPSVRVPGVREVLVLMIPRVVGLGVVQINFLVNINLTSGMVDGSRTALVAAWQLMFFVLGVVAQSAGTAVYPTLSALAAEGDYDTFKERLSTVMRGVLFLAFPASTLLIVLGAPAIRLLLERGEWTAESTAGTAWALAFFAVGIAGHALLEVLSRAFYALSDTRTPVLIGIASIVLNIILSLVLIRVMGSPDQLANGPFAGLALANSIATMLEALVLWWLLRRRIGGLRDRYILDGSARTLAAAIAMGVGIVVVTGIIPDAQVLLELIGAAVVGGVLFAGFALLLRLEEIRDLPGLVLRRIRR